MTKSRKGICAPAKGTLGEFEGGGEGVEPGGAGTAITGGLMTVD